MTRLLPRWCTPLLLVVLLLAGDRANAQRKSEAIPGGPEKKNLKILDLFKPVVAPVANSAVAVLVNGKQVALGAVVGADGFILTKDSELRSQDILVRFKDGKEYSARKVADDETWDLALLKVEVKNLKPVIWVESKLAPVGNWVAAVADTDRPVAVGVVSVAARTMPPGPKIALPKNNNKRGYLGIQMEDDEDGEGVVITLVSPKTPADKAGFKKSDMIVAVDGKPTPNRETLGALIGRRQPGDSVAIRFRRDGKEEERKVTLDKFPFQDRGDFQNNMGTDRSERRTGFPTALQHDIDLTSYQCGGPLVDIEGRVIGLNIARGGRTDTYAIPSEVLKPLVSELLAKASPATVNVSALVEKIKFAQQAVKDAEAQKIDAEKKLVEAKAALEKLLVEQKREKDKK